MVRSPSQIIKSLSPLYLPSIVKAYDIYSKTCIAMMIHAQWIDYFEHKNAHWWDMEYFIQQCSNGLQINDYKIERFVEFKCLSDDELPNDTLKDLILSECDGGSIEYQMETISCHISKLKSVVGNNDWFSLIFKCTLVALLTSHSNASIESIFSA